MKKEIERYAAWRKEWQNEQQKWSRWQQELDDQKPRQIQEAFKKAQGTISTVLDLIDTQLERMLELQAKSVEIGKRVNLIKCRPVQPFHRFVRKKNSGTNPIDGFRGLS